MKILNFGSLNLDYVYQVDHMVQPGETLSSRSRSVFCGGKGLNQSIALARAGAKVFHAGAIGEEGEPLVEALEASGVDCTLIARLPVATGHAVIQVDQSGQNCILLYGGANRAIDEDFAHRVLASCQPGDYLLLQNEISPLPYIIEEGHRRGARMVLNPSPFDDEIEKCDLNKISIFLLNEIEGAQMTGREKPEEILDEMNRRYPQAEIVLTLGKAGSIYSKGSERLHQAIYPVEAVDTTAAGDTFTGYFLAARMEGRDAAFALSLASKASALAVTRQGASPSIPERAEVEAWKTTQ
jgi:ribokinase